MVCPHARFRALTAHTSGGTGFPGESTQRDPSDQKEDGALDSNDVRAGVADVWDSCLIAPPFSRK